ncbi:hypothetical protein NWP22_12620 [Anabaenopsis tanganyikae CS-531]|uniref:Uncharacterized protein n=2 Tax=Anabaenopsis TaxID=110103 RepID=A0ABT5AT22_9CYAN|nr:MULTISPECIES: hypothetical protein [Anabaenopsis]MDB9540092.1 hypothetical protein [Anabaenopsis arnoldii]MDH6092452.1 hypothetical protein [Anabaenopsis arnoldii]MDH6099606.1 hypothetical protein [Anabaenopsis sp. FSS-46]MDH6106702.1 hypothetical protein [Anabaenopsis tanganyikae CS-531]
MATPRKLSHVSPHQMKIHQANGAVLPRGWVGEMLAMNHQLFQSLTYLGQNWRI